MAAPSRYRRRKGDTQYEREVYEETRKVKRARAKARQVKAHKRKQAGKVVHVKAYCRRPANRAKRGTQPGDLF